MAEKPRGPEAQRRAAQGPLTLLGPDYSLTWEARGDAFSLLGACFDLELEQQLASAPDVERPHDGGSGDAEDGSFYYEGDWGVPELRASGEGGLEKKQTGRWRSPCRF